MSPAASTLTVTTPPTTNRPEGHGQRLAREQGEADGDHERGARHQRAEHGAVRQERPVVGDAVQPEPWRPSPSRSRRRALRPTIARAVASGSSRGSRSSRPRNSSSVATLSTVAPGSARTDRSRRRRHRLAAVSIDDHDHPRPRAEMRHHRQQFVRRAPAGDDRDRRRRRLDAGQFGRRPARATVRLARPIDERQRLEHAVAALRVEADR